MYTLKDHINTRQIFRNFPNQYLIPPSERDSYYNHLTLRVSSLSEFVEVVSELTGKSRGTEYAGLIYRGHSDSSSNFKLIPSIARYNESLEASENIIVRELMTLRPDEFCGVKSNFDLLAKMQHYGLPTRILDFSFNPLIALFFACCDGHTQGRVLCTSDTSSLGADQIIEKICGMYHYDDYSAISLDSVLGDISTIRKYALYNRIPLVKKPKYSNDRIKNQAAVFMIFPNVVYDRRSKMIELSRKYQTAQEEYRIGFSMTDLERKRLPYICEENGIYKESFEVTSETLKRLFEFYSKKFDDFYSEEDFGINSEYNFLLKDRFSVENEIQKLSTETITEAFISIIIDYKYKSKIMDELEMVGIDKAFVYPELMYTAEKIKNKYVYKRESWE